MRGGEIADPVVQEGQQVEAGRDLGGQTRFLGLSGDARKLDVEIRQTASRLTGINGQLQEGHVQAKSSLARKAGNKRESPLSQRERFAVREQSQAALASRDACACRKLRIPAERGMVGDVSGQAALHIVASRQGAGDLKMDHASARFGEIAVRDLTDQIVREITVGAAVGGASGAYDAAALEVFHRGEQIGYGYSADGTK